MLGIAPVPGAVAGPHGRDLSRRPRGRRRRPAVEALESRRLLALAINEFPLPTPNSGPEGIAAGPDGNLWFTENRSNKIGRITTSGAITEFPIPTPNSNLQGIVAGPDGALWFTEQSGNKIGRITTAGAITEYPLPTPYGFPLGIAAGPDGALWFTEHDYSSGYKGKIGRITTAGAVTEFPAPVNLPVGIAAGPDGNLWFTGSNLVPVQLAFGVVVTRFEDAIIGRVTTSGLVTGYPLPDPASRPSGIAAGPDGNLWFTEGDGNKIGQAVLKGPGVTYADLAITSAVSGPATAGLPQTYTLTVTNTGPGATNGVIVADTLPAGAAFASAIASQGGVPGQLGGVVTAHLGNLAAGATATVTIVVVPAAAGMVTNSASVMGDAYDSNPANETTTLSTTVKRPTADLAIASAVSPDPATAGQPLAYTLTVVDTGPDPALGVTVTDILPAGAAFASATASQGAAPMQAGRVVTAHLGNLAAGATATVTIAVVPAAAGALANVAGVATSSYDADPANNTTAQTTTINPPATPAGPPARVVGLWRYGYHAQPTLLVVGFSAPLDPASAQNVGNYELVGPLRGRRGVGPTIPIASAALVAGGAEVVLAPARRLNLHYRYRLVIDGSSPTGVRDASGRLIDGAGAGQPGGDFAATFGREVLAGPAPAARRWAAAVRPLAAHASWSAVARARRASR